MYEKLINIYLAQFCTPILLSNKDDSPSKIVTSDFLNRKSFDHSQFFSSFVWFTMDFIKVFNLMHNNKFMYQTVISMFFTAFRKLFTKNVSNSTIKIVHFSFFLFCNIF